MAHNMQLANYQLLLKQVFAQQADTADSQMSVFKNVAIILAVTTSFDLIGTLLGSAMSKVHKGSVHAAENWLARGMFWRFLLMLIMAILYHLKIHAPWIFVVLTSVDFIVSGVMDTTRAVLAMLIEPDRQKRKTLNSSAETSFQLGSIFGPLLTGIFLFISNEELLSVIYFPAILFALATLLAVRLKMIIQNDTDEHQRNVRQLKKLTQQKKPLEPHSTSEESPLLKQQSNMQRLHLITLLIMGSCLQFNRMKNIIPSVLLNTDENVSKSVISWLIAFFGLGNAMGAFVARYFDRVDFNLGVVALILFGLTFVIDNIYLIIGLVILSNGLLGIFIVHINSGIQDHAKTDLWLIGFSRTLYQISLVAQKAFIAIALAYFHFDTIHNSFTIITAMFLVLAAVYGACSAWITPINSDTRSEPRNYIMINHKM